MDDEKDETQRAKGRQDEPDRLPLIFVVGGARSGTTLVARILGAHPNVLHLGETHFFEAVWAGVPQGRLDEGSEGLTEAARWTLQLLGRYGFEVGQKRVEAALTEESLLESAREAGGGPLGLYRGFAARMTAAEGKTVFCEDTPKHAFYLDVILAQLPESRVVACVRDPRDYLSSYKNYWRRSRESERVRAIYHPLTTSLLWRSTWQALRQHLAGPYRSRIFLNRYEDLVAEPEGQVRRLCAALGLAFSPTMLEVEGSNTSFEEGQAGVFASSVGRYRKALTAEEIWVVQRLNGVAMDELGYLREAAPAKAGRLAWLLLTAAPASLRGLYANREKRGPLLPYLRRRLRALLR